MFAALGCAKSCPCETSSLLFRSEKRRRGQQGGGKQKSDSARVSLVFQDPWSLRFIRKRSLQPIVAARTSAFRAGREREVCGAVLTLSGLAASLESNSGAVPRGHGIRIITRTMFINGHAYIGLPQTFLR